MVLAGCLGLCALGLVISVALPWMVVSTGAETVQLSYTGRELTTEPVFSGSGALEPGWFALTWLLGEGTVDYTPGPGIALLFAAALAGAGLFLILGSGGGLRPSVRVLAVGTVAVGSLLASLDSSPLSVDAMAGSGVVLWRVASMAAVVVAVGAAVAVHGRSICPRRHGSWTLMAWSAWPPRSWESCSARRPPPAMVLSQPAKWL